MLEENPVEFGTVANIDVLEGVALVIADIV